MTDSSTSSTKQILQTSTSANPNPISQILIESGLAEVFFSPLGWLLLISVAGLLWASWSVGGSVGSAGKGRKHKLARARWAGEREKTAARKTACKQIRSRKHNRVALYISKSKVDKPIKVKGQYLIHIPESRDRLYFTDAQRGILVSGAPGSGKTYSLINPLARSAIDQGLAIILYDLKYSQLQSPTGAGFGQAAKLAGYALKRDYKVRVLAPGFEESCIANPLDFLQSPTDSGMARQLAITLNKNLKLASGEGRGGEGNPFFTNAGDLLSQGIFQLAKGTKYPDILMCFSILSLPDLIKRLEHADLNVWVKTSFAQFLSVAGSPETAASIVGTALSLFTRFIIPELLGAFCGQTNLPLNLTERQLVIFGTDDEKHDVVSPLVASVLHLLVTHNLAKPRTTPLALFLDESPTIYLPYLARWLNQKRENGLVTILGMQNISQLHETYGEQTAETIFTGCSTKAFFNAGSVKAAEVYSSYLGEEEIVNKKRSKSYSAGSGTSVSHDLDYTTRALFEPSQFNTLKEGRAVIVSPGFKSSQEVALPLLEQIKLSAKIEKELEAESVKLWYDYQQKLQQQSQAQEILEKDLQVRLEEAERLFPLLTLKQAYEKFLPKI